jgi:hypothetical protein
MRRAWIGVAVLVGFFMLAMFLLADAEAQTVSPTGSNAGAFDKLSPGNQKIADSIPARPNRYPATTSRR